MSDFEPEPTLVLSTDAETRAWIEANPRDGYECGSAYTIKGERKVSLCTLSDGVKSLPIIEVIAAIEARGDYPYNATVEREARIRLGLPEAGEIGNEQTPIGWLVYRAQGFRRSDLLRADGFEPLTDALVQNAFERKAGIEIAGHNMLGGKVRERFTVRQIGGKVYVMRPRKRKYAVAVVGQPARIVA